MQFSEMTFPDQLPVDGYGPGFFRIGGVVHKGALLVLPSGIQSWGGYGDHAALIAATGQFDVLFVGTGAEIAHPPQEFRAAMQDAGFGVEPMASPSACRTYNILVSEGRRIGMALLAL